MIAARARIPELSWARGSIGTRKRFYVEERKLGLLIRILAASTISLILVSFQQP